MEGVDCGYTEPGTDDEFIAELKYACKEKSVVFLRYPYLFPVPVEVYEKMLQNRPQVVPENKDNNNNKEPSPAEEVDSTVGYEQDRLEGGIGNPGKDEKSEMRSDNRKKRKTIISKH